MEIINRDRREDGSVVYTVRHSNGELTDYHYTMDELIEVAAAYMIQDIEKSLDKT